MKKIFNIVVFSLIIMCGVMFAGCGPSYSSLSLSFSSEKIEMLRTDESESFTITIENYFKFDAKFDFSFEKPIAKVVENSLKDVGEGVYTFSIAPLIAGTTNLTITLRGTDKQIVVPVYIKEQITSFEPVENIFAIRGKSLSLDESLFTFTPIDTTEKGLSYDLAEGYKYLDGIYLENNILTVESNPNTLSISEVELIVTSTSKSELTKSVFVKLVNEVDITNLNISTYGLSKQENSENYYFDSEKIENIYYFDANSNQFVNNNINLVINEELEYQKQINIEFDKWDSYNVEVYTNDEIDGDLTKITPLKNKTENFSFTVQTGNIGTYNLTVKVYQTDFPSNYKIVNLTIVATCVPTSIKINGQNDLSLVEFYTNGSEQRDFNFSIFPESSLVGTTYTYNIDIYTYSGTEFPKIVDDNFSKLNSMPTSYLQVSYNGTKIGNVNELTNLNSLSYLTLKPMANYDNYFAFKVSCLSDGEELVSNIMYVKIYLGATEFGIDSSKYANNTIYISADSSYELFDEFVYTNGSSIGNLTIMQRYLIESTCDIEQVAYSADVTKPTLKISPKKVGETEYIIITPNNLTTTLKVIVVRLITESDFSIVLSDENGDNLASFNTNSLGSLTNVVIKGKADSTGAVSGSVIIKDKITGHDDVNNLSYNYEVSYVGTNFEVVNNKTIIAKSFTDTTETIKVTAKFATLTNFVLNYEEANFDFAIKCIEYIESLSITANNGLDDTTNRLKVVSVYDRNVLSYKNLNMSEAYIYLNLNYSGGIQNSSSDITLKSWSISGLSYEEDEDLKAKEEKTNEFYANVGSIGYFYPNYSDDAKYVGKFVCSITGISSVKEFTIALTVQDKNTNEIFTDYVTVTIQKYVDVDSLWLKTGTDSIYLDNTAENRTQTVSVYVLPANATFQEIAIEVETATPNCIDWQFVGDVITFRFVSAGEGNIYIFPVSKMKVSNQIPEYNICLPFTCADGSEEALALKLSTYEDLKAINSTTHYFLDSIIDCGGRELYIKEFDASLRGTKLYSSHANFSTAQQVGGITNFVVYQNATNNHGLFGTLGQNAKLYNLEINGKFKNVDEDGSVYSFKFSTSTNIGLLAGQNRGVINNVTISLYEANSLAIIASDSSAVINVGLAVGVNEKVIKADENAKNSTLFINNTEETKLTAQITGDYNIANFGAVSGRNTADGTITFDTNIDEFISLGLYGTNVGIYAELKNFDNVGGIVGDNIGEITNCKAVGTISRTKTQATIINSSNVGGLIGIQNGSKQVSNNISRVYVRGTGVVAGLIGTISSVVSNDLIKNNKVQATDSGKISINASLIVGFGDEAQVYGMSSVALDSSNIALTYVDRTIASDTTINEVLSVDQYYGDILLVSDLASGADIKSEITGRVFERGTDIDLSGAMTCFALAIFKKAQIENEQALINNTILTQEILKIANITAQEVNISVNNISMANIANYGKMIDLYNTGTFTITISSALNYKNVCDITLCITNYYDGIKMYEDKDKSQEITHVELYNNKTSVIYLNCYANDYNANFQAVKLVSNDELKFEVKDSDNVNIDTLNQSIFFTSVYNVEGTEKLEIYPILVINGQTYYQYYNEDVKQNVFINKDESTKEKIPVNVQIITGIDSIKVTKTYITAEPTDVITFEITEITYNTQDTIVPTLKVGENTYIYDGEYFIDSIGTKLFKLTKNSEEVISEGKIKSQYSLSMVISEYVYNNFKDKTIKLEFTAEKTKVSNIIEVAYSPETISAVLVNNYSFEENENMIVVGEQGGYKYQSDNALSVSAYSSTGDINILAAYVYTNLSEFNYVDVTMNVGTQGGYLALVDSDGKISTRGLITSIGGVVNLRLYKTDLISIEDLYSENGSRTLKIIVMYSLPNTITDSVFVPITYNFYNNDNEVCYTKEINVISKVARQVSFKIYDKTANESGDISIDQEYDVARGMTYALETNIVGYNANEVYFESSNNSIASVEYSAGIYYLKITSGSLAYPDDGGFEVTIKSYGKKTENNMTLKSRVQTTKLNIYEICLDSSSIFNADDEIALKVLQKTDVRDLIVNKLNTENNNNLTSSALKSLKNDFKNNAIFKIVSDDFEEVLSDGVKINNFANFEIDGFNILTKALIEDVPFKIVVEFGYKYSSGKPAITTEITDNYVSFEFDVSTYLNSTEEIPQPIFTYNDLLNVKDDENYRLVNDITIKASELQMITAKPKSLDGNGYVIYIEGGATKVTDASNFALFEEIGSDSVFKNITISIKANLTITVDNTYSTAGANIGILASLNSGVITNCRIQTSSVIFVNILGTVSIMESSNFGTICASNNGYITNSQVVANITINGASVGGLVAVNSNEAYISSCYVKNSRIYNTTSTTNANIVTGGLCCNNSGSISMSYVEGAFLNKVYCTYPSDDYSLTSKIIYTSTAVAGFVYENSGSISDCYSNIPIVSSSRCAGFVGINKEKGVIERTYSLSQMKAKDTLNYCFVITNETGSTFKDCFFVIENGIINYNTAESNYVYDGISKYSSKISGITPLGINDFDVVDSQGNFISDSPFKNFIVNSTNAKNGIWFYAYDETQESGSMYFEKSYECVVEGFKTYNRADNSLVDQKFSARRLQLVSPNILAYSKQEFEENKGEYTYYYDNSSLIQGSEYNPYLITSATDLEAYCNQANKNNYEYFRLVKNVDYLSDNIFTSKLYNKTLVGHFEGNNFNISNYAINTKDSLSYAGLFSQFGYSSTNISVLKNVEFKPSYINLPNCIAVGAVAGNVTNSDVYNISIVGNDVIVTGNNIVGGLFGLTSGINNINTVSSDVIAKASKFSSSLEINKGNISGIVKDISYSTLGTNKSQISYAGAVIGYLAGSTTIEKVNVGENAGSYALISGLLFGGVGSLTIVQTINLQLNSHNNKISAFAFGGIITGELKGTIQNITINSNTLTKGLFSCYPITPIAIGGIAGIVDSGKITNVKSDGYSVIGTAFTGNYSTHETGLLVDKINNPYVVNYVGGIAGYATKATIDTLDVNNLIVSGGSYVGGVVGAVDNTTHSTKISNINLSLTGHKKYINQENVEIDEVIYTSYVSEAVSQNIQGYEFNSTQMFGFVVGNLETYENLTYCTVESCTIKTDEKGIFIYFASYTKTGVPPTSYLVANTDAYGSVTSNYLITMYNVNLSDNTTTFTKIPTE